MRVALFCHSLLSDWNNKSAHFHRGIATELLARRHDVRVFEPRSAWSVESLVKAEGPRALDLAKAAYPRIRPTRYDLAELDLEAALDGVDVVVVHEHNEPSLVARIGELRKRAGTKWRALFHDTHHRAVTDENAMAAFDLGGYDGVLAFSGAVREAYAKRGWSERAWTWHEAADPRMFFPHPTPPGGKEGDVAPDESERWIPNWRLPELFARFKMTVHVPRRPFPSIRVFEALASAIPLVVGSFEDGDGLFTPGSDYLFAKDRNEIDEHVRDLANDAHLRAELARQGRRTILERHTCAHRVDELLAIAVQLGVRVQRPAFLEVAL